MIAVTASCWRSTVPPASFTVQPFAQLPDTGAMVIEALRVIASLRACTRLENTSKLAVLTRWLRTNWL